jgi:hypothetical protein
LRFKVRIAEFAGCGTGEERGNQGEDWCKARRRLAKLVVVVVAKPPFPLCRQDLPRHRG